MQEFFLKNRYFEKVLPKNLRKFNIIFLLNPVPFSCITHMTFNAIRLLKKIVLTFSLHKVFIKCCVSIRKLINTIEKIKTRNVLEEEVQGIKIDIK